MQPSAAVGPAAGSPIQTLLHHVLQASLIMTRGDPGHYALQDILC